MKLIINSIIVSIFLLSTGDKGADLQVRNGVYIYSVHSINPVTGERMKMMPDDSLFFFNGIAIEKVMKNEDFVVNNRLKRTVESTQAFNVIDFRKKKYTQVTTLDSIKRPLLLEDPLSSPKLGINFSYQYYNGEKFSSKDTIIKNSKYTLVSYISNADGPNRGALMKIFLSSMDGKFDYFVPNIEKQFNGRFKMMEVVYPANQGTLWLTLDFKPGLSNYWLSIFNKIQ